ncbi:hypothetical protein CEXT_800311 [Caerostris extrusa]|uniref:Uncharacterized protein n=1 Tax=Caerostris extrusa TaxID=172846 RepID=A0AAV4T976_CAEEX|nr:hypothetical protein CEXT_800311 [Caerostris extrusa]
MNNRQAWRRKTLHAVMGTRQTHHDKRIPQKKRRIRDKDSGNKVDDIVWHTVTCTYPSTSCIFPCDLLTLSYPNNVFLLSSPINWEHKFCSTCHLHSQCLGKKANGMNNRQAWRRRLYML